MRYAGNQMLDLREIAPETARPIRREEYERMVELGLFDDERVELLEGVIVQMSPKGPPHESTIDRLNAILVKALDPRARIRVQGSFAASETSEPEPDLAVLPPRDYDTGHPERAFLLIEVSDSSLRKDRGLKARLYAESNVPEYWVVNLVDRVVEVHRDPEAARYRTIETCGAGAAIRLVQFSDVVVAVDDFLRR
jgi:Uma2 family endonuclease